MANCLLKRSAVAITVTPLWTTSSYTTKPTTITLSQAYTNFDYIAIQWCRFKPAEQGLYVTTMIHSSELDQESLGTSGNANTGMAGCISAGNYNNYTYANSFYVASKTSFVLRSFRGGGNTNSGGYPVQIWGVKGLKLIFPWIN